MSPLYERVAARAVAADLQITAAGVAEIQRLIIEESDDLDLLLGFEGPHVRADGSCAHGTRGWADGVDEPVACTSCFGRRDPRPVPSSPLNGACSAVASPEKDAR